MSWVKIDDQFPDHRKILAVGPLAAWLHVCGLCYCARLLTDGFIPKGQVRKLADLDDPSPLVDILTREKLWIKVDGGYRIHDYLEYNPPAEKVKAERVKTAARVAEWREKNASNTVGNAVTEGVGNAVSTPPPVPVPVPPPDARTRTQTPASGTALQVGRTNGSAPTPAGRVWDAYSLAYFGRYGADPVRNSKVNGQLAQLVKRLPADDAPKVAAFYVGHNGSWYVKRGHSVDCLLKDCEALHTQMLTKRTVHAKDAQELDRLSADMEMWNRVGERLENRKAQGETH